MNFTRIAQSGILRTVLAIVAVGYIASRVQWHDTYPPANQVRPADTSTTSITPAANDLSEPILGLKSIWRMSFKPFLLAAVGIFALVPMLQATRLWWMLQRHHQNLSFNECLSMTLRGNFMNFAAPFGSTAGDVCKAYWIARRTRKSAESATLIMLDRAIGLGTLLIGVAVVIILLPNERLEPFRSFVLFVCGGAGASFVLYVMPFVRNHRIMAFARKRVRFFDRMESTLWHLVSNWRTMFVALGITTLIHVAAAAAFALGFIGLHLHWTSGPPAFYASFSLGELVKALPGPPQGLGTMELAYEWLFAGAGTISQIVAAALVLRLVNLCCALPGGILIMLENSRITSQVSTPEIRTVKSVNHPVGVLR